MIFIEWLSDGIVLVGDGFRSMVMFSFDRSEASNGENKELKEKMNWSQRQTKPYFFLT